MAGISTKAPGKLENRYKFIGQELDSELDWNMYQFRYRNHDPQIGRFIQVDPLASDYVYNSTYAYAENKLGLGFDLEGLELQNFNKALKWGGYDIQRTGQKVEASVNKAISDAKPYAEGAMTGIKYVGITSAILLGGPAGLILGLPALGLTITQDVALAKDPNNEKAQNMPTSVGGAVGLAGDKITESVTGKKTNGLLQEIGALVETLYSGKDILKGDITPIENIDRLNTVIEATEGVKKVNEKIKETKPEDEKQNKPVQN